MMSIRRQVANLSNMEQPPHSSLHRNHHHSHHHHHHHHHHLVINPSSLTSPLNHHHHHHHHHHVVLQCALHNKVSQNPNSNFCPNLITPFPQIPKNASSLTSHNNPYLGSSSFQAPPTSQDTQSIQDDGVDNFEVVDEEEDPIFVMTDEWREFFAKSEARRREAKKLAKKQGKI